MARKAIKEQKILEKASEFGDTPKDRLLKYCLYLGERPNPFCLGVGLPNGYLTHGGGMNTDSLKSVMEKHAQLNMEWLINGSGEMLKENVKYVNKLINQVSEQKDGRWNGGLLPESVAVELILRPEDFDYPERRFHPNFVYLSPKEASAGDRLVRLTDNTLCEHARIGDRILVSQLEKAEWTENFIPSSLLLLVLANGRTLAGKVANYNSATAELSLHAENPDKERYPDLKINRFEIREVWKVKRFINQP